MRSFLAVPLLFVMCLLMAAPAVHAQGGARAGEISFVAGMVTVGEGSQARPASTGDAVGAGDLLVTGASGHVHVRTVDDGFLALRPNSRARIAVFEYDAAAPDRTRIRLELDSGVMRTVSGRGAQAARERFRLNTPVAAVGIRGTDFTVSTTDTVTRAVVRSGEIVVAPFNGDCRADGLGPCGGAGARALAGDQSDRLLELRRGDREATLVEIRPGGAAPDQVAPPHPGEKGAAAPAAPAASLGVQAVAASTEGALGQQLSGAGLAPPPVIDPPPAVQPPPVVEPPKPPPSVVWGRWAALAGQPAPVSPNQLAALNGAPAAINRLYLLFVKTDAAALPQVGRFDFALDKAEAFLVDAGGRFLGAASVDTGTLSVDFGLRRFSTGLAVTAQSVTRQLRADGSLLADGRLQSNLLYFDGVTNTVVNGAVGGAQGNQAGYVFEHKLNPGSSLVGVTGWRR